MILPVDILPRCWKMGVYKIGRDRSVHRIFQRDLQLIFQAISTADVCLLAAMCILSSGDRDRIRRIILERSSFRAGLDDTQAWISDLTRAFVSANYQVVSRILAKVEVSLLAPCL